MIPRNPIEQYDFNGTVFTRESPRPSKAELWDSFRQHFAASVANSKALGKGLTLPGERDMTNHFEKTPDEY